MGTTEVRTPVDATTWPWSAIVRVQVPGISRCSGFLIGPARVVTAAHCLWAARPQHMVQPSSIHILAQYRLGQYAGHRVAASYVLGDGYDPVHPGKTAGADFAVLTLGEPLPGRTLALGAAHPGAAAMLAGYEQDRVEVLLADRDCRAMGVVLDPDGRSLRQHSCAATSGSSGAPLLIRDPRAGWAAAGVQIRAETGEAGGVAIPAEIIAARLSRP